MEKEGSPSVEWVGIGLGGDVDGLEARVLYDKTGGLNKNTLV